MLFLVYPLTGCGGAVVEIIRGFANSIITGIVTVEFIMCLSPTLLKLFNFLFANFALDRYA